MEKLISILSSEREFLRNIKIMCSTLINNNHSSGDDHIWVIHHENGKKQKSIMEEIRKVGFVTIPIIDASSKKSTSFEIRPKNDEAPEFIAYVERNREIIETLFY